LIAMGRLLSDSLIKVEEVELGNQLLFVNLSTSKPSPLIPLSFPYPSSLCLSLTPHPFVP